MTESETDKVERNQDDEHIRLLVVFHYIFAALTLFGLVFLGLHYTIMNSAFASEEFGEGFSGDEFFSAFMWFYVFMGVILIADGVINLLSAIFMTQRRNRTFSLIVAGLNCLYFPIGSLLGVFTILVLMRPSVRDSYSPQLNVDEYHASE